MFTEKEAEEKIRSIIAERLEIDEAMITLEKYFVKDLGADSLDTVELVLAFEDELGIEVPDQDAEALKTVKDVVDFVVAYKK